MQKKYILVLGGCISGIGKGVFGSSTALLMKQYTDLPIRVIKIDPYLNVFPGLLNPEEHGEVFVTRGGYESDVDLGHYERMLDQPMSHENNITTGQIFHELYMRECQGAYKGDTLQVGKQFTELLWSKIRGEKQQEELVLCEIGGTIQDLEARYILETWMRALRRERADIFVILNSYVFYLEHLQEYKTRLVQKDILDLSQLSLSCDLLVLRSHRKLPLYVEKKIQDHLPHVSTIALEDLRNINETVYKLEKQHLAQLICNRLGILQNKKPHSLFPPLPSLRKRSPRLKIGIVGKYKSARQSHFSIFTALEDAANLLSLQLNIVDFSFQGERKQDLRTLKRFKRSRLDGVVFTGGWGTRATESMLSAIQHCRECNMSTLGLCLGMQLMLIEFARNQLSLPYAISEEWRETASQDTLIFVKTHSSYLGTYAHYNLATKTISQERSRHSYIFNVRYREQFEHKGFAFTSYYTKNPEVFSSCQLQKHYFYKGYQYHPEFESNPRTGHPVFLEFLQHISANYKEELSGTKSMVQ